MNNYIRYNNDLSTIFLIMKIYIQTNDSYKYEIISDNTGSILTLQFNLTDLSKNKLLFVSNSLKIPKYLLNNLSTYIKNGDLDLSIRRLDFMDAHKSYMVIFDSRRQIVVRTYNLKTCFMEDLNLKNLNTEELSTLFEE